MHEWFGEKLRLTLTMVTAIPIAGCGVTSRKMRIERKLSCIIKLKTVVKSNLKICCDRRLGLEDTLGIQAPLLLSRFFWVVSLAGGRTLGFIFSVFLKDHEIFFRNQADTRFHRLTLASHKLQASSGCSLSIFAGARWKLQRSDKYLALCGSRIYSSKVENREDYSGEQMIDTLISKRNEKTGVYSNIFEMMVNRENLFEAWISIKNKAGNLTSAGNKETLDGLTNQWFDLASERLLKGTYKYTPVRRVAIPKAKGSFRSLTIANPRDKVIQKAFLQILNPIWEGSWVWNEVSKKEYEENTQLFTEHYPSLMGRMKVGTKYYVREWLINPVFLSSSHGFRAGRGVHSTLKEIKSYWADVNWFLKFDIKKAFDKMNHHRLFKAISHYVSDKRVQDELYKMLNVKGINWRIHSDGLGVPQGSILSPFLFNVYMHDLDVYVAKLVKDKDCKSVKIENAEYASERQKLYKHAKKEGMGIRSRLRATAALRKKLKRNGVKLFTHKVVPVHFYYLRYADDFLIGVKGDKSAAKTFQKNVKEFIKSTLHLEISQEYLKHTRSDKTKWLGFLLSVGTLGARTKGRTVERFERLKNRYKVLRKAEYKSYLKVLREAEKRYWMRCLEKMCRRQEQNMISKIQIVEKVEDLAKAKVLDFFLEQLKAERDSIDVLQNIKTESIEKFKDNSPLQLARSELKKEWSSIIREWSNRARAVSRVVPEAEAELLGIIGGPQLEALVEARDNYNRELDHLSSPAVRKQVVSFVYSKHMEKGLAPKKRGGGNVAALIQNEFSRKIRRATIFIEMPYESMKAKFREKGYIKDNTPSSKSILATQNPVDIIGHYAQTARGIMNFYRCADNKWQLVTLINWWLRYSLLKTLAQKYSSSVSKIIANFSITPSVWSQGRGERKNLVLIESFITPNEVSTMKKTFLVSDLDMSPEDLKKCLNATRVKTSKYQSLWCKCAVHNCNNSDIEMHHIRKLIRRFKGNIVTVKVNSRERSGNTGKSAYNGLISALTRKQIPLCSHHHKMVHCGSLDPKDINLKFANSNILYFNGSLESVLTT